MISNYSLDFCSIKCVFDLSRNYVGACLAQNILLNEGFISTCNSDTKGAVTMYMINLLNKSSIVYRPDIMKIDYANNTISLRSDGIGNFDMCESKKNICLDYQSKFESPSGGICLNRAVFKQGQVNLAMLSKDKDRFCFHISEGETYFPREDDFLIKDQWDQVPPRLPWAYVKIKGNMDNFVLNSFSGFTILVLDDIRRELIYLAKLLNIDVSLDY
jgi:L-fucose isomerase-like protein